MSEKDVLPDREILAERGFLIHDADAQGVGVDGRGKGHRRPVERGSGACGAVRRS